MTVQELMDELSKVKDKTKKVTVDYGIEIDFIEENADGYIQLRY
jgi:hypothetical protein